MHVHGHVRSVLNDMKRRHSDLRKTIYQIIYHPSLTCRNCSRLEFTVRKSTDSRPKHAEKRIFGLDSH